MRQLFGVGLYIKRKRKGGGTIKKCSMFISFFLAMILLTACAGSALPPAPSSLSPGIAEASSDTESNHAVSEIALIGTQERLDMVFGQSVWHTISRFAGESGLSSSIYLTEADNAVAALSTLELAITGGAKIVFTVDPTVSLPIAEAANKYPDVSFVFLDLAADTSMGRNAAAIQFSEVQAGWLAGYVAVYQGYQILSCVVTPDPADQRYLLGFIQGVEAASAKLAPPDSQEPYAVVYTALLEEVTEEAMAQQAELLWQTQTQLLFIAQPDLVDFYAQKALAQSVDIITLPMPDSFTLPNLMAQVSFEPKNPVYDILNTWKTKESLGKEVIWGSVFGGDISLRAGNPKNFGELDANIRRSTHSFDDGRLEKELEALLTSGAGGSLPAWQDLQTPHVTLLAPGNSGASVDLSDSVLSSSVAESSSKT